MTTHEALQTLSVIATTLDEEDAEELYERVKSLYGKEEKFILNIEGEKCVLITEHAFLELERLRKNKILNSSVNKTVKVKGVVSDVKLYSNTALFCLSPCEVNGIDIGHTWVRYTPSFKNIKLGTVATFYSEIKRYGDLGNKSGVNWNEISYVRMKGGDNSPLYSIPIHDSKSDYPDWDKEQELLYKPSPSNHTLKALRFCDIDGESVIYHTLSNKLVLGPGYIIKPGREEQHKLDSLLLFEWLARLEDWEFWWWARRSAVS